MDGSTSAEPILSLIACKFLDVPCRWMDWLDGERRLIPDYANSSQQVPSFSVSGTHQAYVNLIEGQADMILVAREPSREEFQYAVISGVRLDVQPVALDAFVFIVNEENPVDGLSTVQIQQIYSGRLTNWREVGGQDGEIHPYQRDDNSGSQELMRKLVMQGKSMIEAPQMILPTMFAPFYAVSEDSNGIGYSVYYYEEFMAPRAERTKLVAVDGVRPDTENIRSQEYPYTTEVYTVTRTNLPKDSLAYRLKDWLRSPVGHELISESGYIPIY